MLSTSRTTNDAVDTDAAPYNYANDNDANFCGQDGDDDNDGGGNGNADRTRAFDVTVLDDTVYHGGSVPEFGQVLQKLMSPRSKTPNYLQCVITGSSQELSGENLLVAPRQVEKININFERVAKRVNVKQLKFSIWDELAAAAPIASKHVDAGKEPKEPLTMSSDVPKAFSDVYAGSIQQKIFVANKA